MKIQLFLLLISFISELYSSTVKTGNLLDSQVPSISQFVQGIKIWVHFIDINQAQSFNELLANNQFSHHIISAEQTFRLGRNHIKYVFSPEVTQNDVLRFLEPFEDNYQSCEFIS